MDAYAEEQEQAIILETTTTGGAAERAAAEEKKKERLLSLGEFQVECVSKAMTFPNVRKISYSTCSIYAEENEHVVTTLLKKHWPTWKLTPRAKVLPTWHRRGYPSEVCDIPGLVSTDEDRAKIADCVVRAVPGGPEGDLMNGFFVACFERVGKNSLPGLSPVWKGPSIGGVKRAHEEADEMDDTTTEAATEGSSPAKKKKKNKKKKKKNTIVEAGDFASAGGGGGGVGDEGDEVEDDEASGDDE